MLTPEQIDHLSDRMEKLCEEYQSRALRKVPEFLAFLEKPGVSQRDKRQAERQFNAYISKLIASLRKKSNRVLMDTVYKAAAVSLKSDREIIETAEEVDGD